MITYTYNLSDEKNLDPANFRTPCGRLPTSAVKLGRHVPRLALEIFIRRRLPDMYTSLINNISMNPITKS